MSNPSVVARLRAFEAEMTPGRWRGRAFKDGPGGIWRESTAAVFTCPNVDGADMEGVAAMRNAFHALLAVAEAASEALFECDSLEHGEPWWRNLDAALSALEEAQP